MTPGAYTATLGAGCGEYIRGCGAWLQLQFIINSQAATMVSKLVSIVSG
jgi:hypothetical protein